MSEKLLPCPFCGGDKPIRATTPAGAERHHFIRCHSCAAEGGWAKTVGLAEKFWNMRTPAAEEGAA